MRGLISTCCLILPLFGFAAAPIKPVTPVKQLSHANTVTGVRALQFTPMQFDALPQDQQRAVASAWELNAKQFHQYLHLMQSTPMGIYFKDKPMMPAEIVAMATTDRGERKKLEQAALKQNAQHLEQLFLLTNEMAALYKQEHPHEKPFRMPGGPHA